MIKFLNWVSFLGSLFKAFAKGGREVIPEWEQLKKDNVADKLMQEKGDKNV